MASGEAGIFPVPTLADGARLLMVVRGKRMRDKGQLKHERFRLDIKGRTFHHEDSQALEKVAWRGCTGSMLREFKTKLPNLIRHCN